MFVQIKEKRIRQSIISGRSDCIPRQELRTAAEKCSAGFMHAKACRRVIYFSAVTCTRRAGAMAKPLGYVFAKEGAEAGEKEESE
jgi:hypothetical protein